MIKFVTGDILRTNSEYLAHGVAAAQEDMGTGLALKISARWPEVQKHFRQFARRNKFQGGDLFVVAPARNRPGIIYIATQPDSYETSLPFVNRGLRKLARYSVKNKIESVSLAEIGAESDKLDWETETKPLLMKHLDDLETTFYVYEDSRKI
jgi:O-acetyl-ADP-ribose deacetylase (regulator of RNase III)